METANQVTDAWGDTSGFDAINQSSRLIADLRNALQLAIEHQQRPCHCDSCQSAKKLYEAR